jgi:hypothetical protein
MFLKCQCFAPILFSIHISTVYQNAQSAVCLQHLSSHCLLSLATTLWHTAPRAMFTRSLLVAFSKRPLTQFFRIQLYTYSTRQRLRKFPSDTHVVLASCNIPVSDSLLTLGITLSFDSHVSQLGKQSFLHIRALRRIRLCLTVGMANAAAVAIVQSRIDNSNLLYSMALSPLISINYSVSFPAS